MHCPLCRKETTKLSHEFSRVIDYCLDCGLGIDTWKVDIIVLRELRQKNNSNKSVFSTVKKLLDNLLALVR